MNGSVSESARLSREEAETFGTKLRDAFNQITHERDVAQRELMVAEARETTLGKRLSELEAVVSDLNDRLSIERDAKLGLAEQLRQISTELALTKRALVEKEQAVAVLNTQLKEERSASLYHRGQSIENANRAQQAEADYASLIGSLSSLNALVGGAVASPRIEMEAIPASEARRIEQSEVRGARPPALPAVPRPAALAAPAREPVAPTPSPAASDVLDETFMSELAADLGRELALSPDEGTERASPVEEERDPLAEETEARAADLRGRFVKSAQARTAAA